MYKFHEYFSTIMECLSDGKCYKTKDIREFCCNKLNISEEERQMSTSKGSNVFNNKISWALTYLKKAILIISSKWGFY